jgi:hypothetical protein
VHHCFLNNYVNFSKQKQQVNSSQPLRRKFQRWVQHCAEIAAAESERRHDIDGLEWVPSKHPFPQLLQMFNNRVEPMRVPIKQWCIEVHGGVVAPKREGVPPYWVFPRTRKEPEPPVVRLVVSTGQRGAPTCVTFTRNSLATVVTVVLRNIAKDEDTRRIATKLLEVQRNHMDKSLAKKIGSLDNIATVWEKWPKKDKSLCNGLASAALRWQEAIGLKAFKRMAGDLRIQHCAVMTRYGTDISLSEGKLRDKELEKTLHAAGGSVPTTHLGWDSGMKQATIGGVTPRMADILKRQMKGEEVTPMEKQEVENARTHCGVRYVNVHYKENIVQKTKDERKRARDLKIFTDCLVGGAETLHNKINQRKDFADCSTKVEMLRAMNEEFGYRFVRQFGFSSSTVKQWNRKRGILVERYIGALYHTVATTLPNALVASQSISLERNLPTPPIGANNRREKQRKGKPRAKADAPKSEEKAYDPKGKEEADSPPPKMAEPKKVKRAKQQAVPNVPRPVVRVAIDPLDDKKVRKNTSSFAYVGDLVRLNRLVRCHERMRKTLVLHDVDSHRTTVQAQPTRAIWLGEAGRMNRTKPCPANIPSTWVGSVPNTFKVLYDPLLGTLVNRDSNVPTALAMIDIALHHGLERPNIFCRFSQARTSSGGGEQSHI